MTALSTLTPRQALEEFNEVLKSVDEIEERPPAERDAALLSKLVRRLAELKELFFKGVDARIDAEELCKMARHHDAAVMQKVIKHVPLPRAPVDRASNVVQPMPRVSPYCRPRPR
jgi:hypothetical protein